MAIRQIRYDGDDILKKVSKKVEFLDEKTKLFIQDLKETMYKYDGIGISAVQVGVLKRIIIYDVSYIDDPKNKKPIALINPVITYKSKKTKVAEEGCLSFPKYFGKVIRPSKIIVEALNENFEKVTINASGIEAVVLQHEIDHLDGNLFVDLAFDTYYER